MAQPHPAVAIAGAGAVARTLGRLMIAAGQPIIAVASRTRSTADEAARFIGELGTAGAPPGAAVRVVPYAELPRLASRVLIAVSDRGIEAVAEALAAGGMRSGVALHTCGAKGPDALRALSEAGVACGMLHPLQTIKTAAQGIDSLRDVTFGVSGDREAIDWSEQIVTSLHGRVLHISADRLSYYHAGAVMASNALMAVLDAAVILLTRAGVERRVALDALGPLARTSVDNAVVNGPQAALTGPIARGDATTVAAHMRALRDVEPSVARLYEAAAAQLLQLAKERGLPDDGVRAVESALEANRA